MVTVRFPVVIERQRIDEAAIIRTGVWRRITLYSIWTNHGIVAMEQSSHLASMIQTPSITCRPGIGVARFLARDSRPSGESRLRLINGFLFLTTSTSRFALFHLSSMNPTPSDPASREVEAKPSRAHVLVPTPITEERRKLPLFLGTNYTHCISPSIASHGIPRFAMHSLRSYLSKPQ